MYSNIWCERTARARWAFQKLVEQSPKRPHARVSKALQTRNINDSWPSASSQTKAGKKKKKILELQEEKHKEDTSGTKDVTQRKEIDQKKITMSFKGYSVRCYQHVHSWLRFFCCTVSLFTLWHGFPTLRVASFICEAKIFERREVTLHSYVWKVLFSVPLSLVLLLLLLLTIIVSILIANTISFSYRWSGHWSGQSDSWSCLGPPPRFLNCPPLEATSLV